MKKPITQPNNIDALSDRVAGLAGHQDRFWCELGEAMKRITATEAEINNLAKSVEHLGMSVEATDYAANEMHDRTTHSENRIAALAKTVEVRCCTQPDNGKWERLDSRIVAINDRLCSIEKAPEADHDNAIAFLELAVQTLTQRLAALEARDTEKFALAVIDRLLATGRDA